MFYAHNYFNIFSAPLACLLAIGKGPMWALGCYALAFIVHPLFDWVMNNPLRSFVDKTNKRSAKKLYYELPLLLAPPFQMLLLFYAFNYGTGSFADALLSGALCGLSGGVLGIGTSHELIHRSSKTQRLYGQLMLYTINYPHFYIEHLWHHVAVGTREDADTAVKGESIYRFLLRSIPQGWLKCWKWKAYKKKMLRTTLIQVTLFAACFYLGGMNAFVVYAVQGAVTLCLLKWINYVEHYGLERKTTNGVLEPVSIKHSWDSLSPLTNFSLFNLGFHTHHHKRPTVEYYNLPESTSSWNALPYGYSTMMMMSLVPASWKIYMEKELQKLDGAS